VTDDIVAIIELVKNAYDAGADKVTISLFKDRKDNNDIVLEIFDNGQGMTRNIIENAWFTIATPYKEKNNFIEINSIRRTVSGEKGLGRLSTARLGSLFEMYTKTETEPCWKVSIDWDKIADADNISDAGGSLESDQFPYTNCKSGTVIRIKNLHKNWSDEDILQESIEDLKNNLSRFISPFSRIKKYGQFTIAIKTPLSEYENKVSTPKYLKFPMYSMSGKISDAGTIKYEYKFNNGTSKRVKSGTISQNEIKETDQEFSFCGPFEFELRVWDYDDHSMEIFNNRFEIKKRDLQKSISYHKGISVYRDGVLVLQKTDTSRDWLGLDLRRISRVGARISNRQIIGYVSITAKDNPKIIDASNREGFKNNTEVKTFNNYLLKIIHKLEHLKEEEKIKGDYHEPPFSDILGRIFPGDLKDKIETVINSNGSYEDILNIIREYEAETEKAQDDLKKRAYYYSRMATIGTLSAFIIHEINGRTMDIGSLHTNLRKQEKKQVIKWVSIKSPLEKSEKAVDSLVSLAERFSPLAIKRINKSKCVCDPIDELKAVISVFEQDLIKKDVLVKFNNTSAVLLVFPGEISSIYYNLFSNAIYWLNTKEDRDKIIDIRFSLSVDKKRMIILFQDSGPGIEDGMEEKIFWPGITNRKDGFGMGLTVASELVSQYNGKMMLIKPAELAGAAFRFDLPVLSVRRKK
jgi:signal transduction histidine kinase